MGAGGVDPLRAFARSVAGRDVRIEDLSRHVGHQSVVWRLFPTASDPLILKRNVSAQHYAREMNAYDEYLPALRDDPRWAVPTRVAKDDELRAFVSTALEGTPGERVHGAEGCVMHRLAGALARRVHALPHAETADSRTLVQERIDRYLVPRDGLDDGLLHDTLEVLDEASAFTSMDVVATHGDYSPRNWVFERTSDGPRLGVFDWERALPFIALGDMERMAYDYWHEDPSFRDAFFEGYGQPLTPRERDCLRLLSWAASVASIAWAHMRHDTKFEAVCYEALERIAADSPIR